MDFDVATNDVIAMNLTMAALEHWVAQAATGRSGEELGREVGALYREIHAAVDEMSPAEDDDEDYDFDEDDDEEADDESSD